MLIFYLSTILIAWQGGSVETKDKCRDSKAYWHTKLLGWCTHPCLFQGSPFQSFLPPSPL